MQHFKFLSFKGVRNKVKMQTIKQEDVFNMNDRLSIHLLTTVI